eukprot:2706746-Pyramimonas_sp.AAC.1
MFVIWLAPPQRPTHHDLAPPPTSSSSCSSPPSSTPSCTPPSNKLRLFRKLRELGVLEYHYVTDAAGRVIDTTSHAASVTVDAEMDPGDLERVAQDN